MYDYALYGSSLNTLGTLGLIALVLAIAATVLAFIFIVPAKRRASSCSSAPTGTAGWAARASCS